MRFFIGLLFALTFAVGGALADYLFTHSLFDNASVNITNTICNGAPQLKAFGQWGKLPTFSNHHAIIGLPMTNPARDCGRCVLVSYRRPITNVTGQAYATVVEGLQVMSKDLASYLHGDTYPYSWIVVTIVSAPSEECGLRSPGT